MVLSTAKHPHDVVLPRFRSAPKIAFSVPHSQRHSQYRFFPRLCEILSTVSLPNVRPTIFIIGFGMH